MIRILVLSLVVSTSALGCVTTIPEKTQLQIREFQTRTYDTHDAKMVMKAMLNVLQDDGFIVKNASVELGLLTATKEVDIENKGEVFLLGLRKVLFAIVSFGIVRLQSDWKKNSITEASVNVSEFGTQSRVRANFQVKVMTHEGKVQGVKQIEDEKYYQDFFSKVDKGIFIQKEKL